MSSIEVCMGADNPPWPALNERTANEFNTKRTKELASVPWPLAA